MAKSDRVFLHLRVSDVTRKRLWVTVNRMRNYNPHTSLSTVVDEAIVTWLDKPRHQPSEVEYHSRDHKLMVRVPPCTRSRLRLTMNALQIETGETVTMSAIADEAIRDWLQQNEV